MWELEEEILGGGIMGSDVEGREAGGQRTFFSLFFSATSSLPAFAAWRFSCLAVNYTHWLSVTPSFVKDSVRNIPSG